MKHVQTEISEELRKKLVIKMFETNRHKTVKEIVRLALEEYLKNVSLPIENQPTRIGAETPPPLLTQPPQGGHAEKSV